MLMSTESIDAAGSGTEADPYSGEVSITATDGGECWVLLGTDFTIGSPRMAFSGFESTGLEIAGFNLTGVLTTTGTFNLRYGPGGSDSYPYEYTLHVVNESDESSTTINGFMEYDGTNKSSPTSPYYQVSMTAAEGIGTVYVLQGAYLVLSSPGGYWFIDSNTHLNNGDGYSGAYGGYSEYWGYVDEDTSITIHESADDAPGSSIYSYTIDFVVVPLPEVEIRYAGLGSEDFEPFNTQYELYNGDFVIVDIPHLNLASEYGASAGEIYGNILSFGNPYGSGNEYSVTFPHVITVYVGPDYAELEFLSNPEDDGVVSYV